MESTRTTEPATPYQVASLVLAAVFGSLGAMGWLVVGAGMLLMAPKFEEIFSDFGVAVPLTTRWCFWLVEHWPVIAMLVLVAVGLCGLAIAKRWWPLAILMFASAGISWVAFIGSMQIPLMSMTRPLGSGM